MYYNLSPVEEEKSIAQSSEEYKKYKVSPFYDYSNKGYIKPWGYEYMAFQSSDLAIWILHVNQGLQTSMHCHFYKDTLLCVISGTFRIDLYKDFKILNEGDVCFIPASMFHGIYAYSPNSIILEVEIYDKTCEGLTYSDKNDLLRLKDFYTRDKNTYMGSVIEYTTGDASGNDIIYPFFNLKESDIIYGSTTISRITANNLHLVDFTDRSCFIDILLEGQIKTKNGSILSPGSITDLTINTDKIHASNIVTSSASLLHISNLYKDDNSKLIYTKTHLRDVVSVLRSTPASIYGLTSGCFDIFHSGHISTLKQSNNMCDVFFVCLSSDKQIREIKGSGRPVNNIEDRARMLLTMPFINYVILYDETDNTYEKELDNIMLIIKPDIWFKGSDYTESEIRAKHPSLKRIVLFENIKNKSTTNIISKAQSSSRFTPITEESTFM
jgi:rfaE bifunctional protein nucleotidyltransferase chain/domain